MNICAVVFDWAGTLVDHGSRAPVATLLDIFQGAGVPITVDEARISMGIAKKAHIAGILQIPRVAAAWESARGAVPADGDVAALYTAFIPRQLECLGQFSDVIRGVPEMVDALRSEGIRIGSTTGYTRPMLDFLVEQARRQGLEIDLALCPDDAPCGRPAPYMCWLNAIRLQVFPMWRMVKIGDTPSDIEEGRNAGMWTIGVTRTGNEVGLTEEEWNASSQDLRRTLLAGAALRLAGASYLVESVAECRSPLAEISARIAAGDRP